MLVRIHIDRWLLGYGNLQPYIPQIGESVLHVQHLPPADASLSVGLDQLHIGRSILICGRGNLR